MSESFSSASHGTCRDPNACKERMGQFGILEHRQYNVDRASHNRVSGAMVDAANYEIKVAKRPIARWFLDNCQNTEVRAFMQRWAAS